MNPKSELERMGPWQRLVKISDDVYTIPPAKWPLHNYDLSHQKYLTIILSDVLQHFVGDAKGLSALDYGCNCGWLAFLLRRYGFSHVAGIDSGRLFIDQANLLKRLKGETGVEFSCGSYEEVHGEYDCTFSFGVMNHVDSPVNFLRALYQSTKQALFLDCNCFIHSDGNSQSEFNTMRSGNMGCHVSQYGSIAFNFSRDSVEMLLKAAGFSTVYIYSQKHKSKKDYYVNRIFCIALKSGCRYEVLSEDYLTHAMHNMNPRQYVDDSFAIANASLYLHNVSNLKYTPQMKHYLPVYHRFSQENPGRKVYVWGSAEEYRQNRHLISGLDLIGFVDDGSNAQLGETIEGVQVLSPHSLNHMERHPILIFSPKKYDIFIQILFQLKDFNEIV